MDLGTPGLRSAKDRTTWAAIRKAELERLENQLKAIKGPVVITADRGAWERQEPLAPTVEFAGLSKVNTGSAPIFAGEILYHLRTALEYLAYNLVWLEAGSPQPRTAFPILDHEKDWPKTCRSQLKGVRTSRLELLREYQPFAGCLWTQQLRNLSNADKHRVIVGVAKQSSGSFQVNDDTVKHHPTQHDRVIIDGGPQALTLVLDDGRSVVPLLAELMTQVAQLLHTFQSVFGESDTLTIDQASERYSLDLAEVVRRRTAQ